MKHPNMKEVLNIVRPILNNIEGHPFVLGPQGPYDSIEEAKQGLTDFYKEKEIPNGQPVVIQGKWYIYKEANDSLVYFCTNDELNVVINTINEFIKQNNTQIENNKESILAEQTKIDELNILINSLNTNVHFLGNFSSAGDAENAAKNPTISGNNNIIIIRFTVNSIDKEGIIIQQVGDYRTVQYYIWDACIYTRHIWFTNNTRTTINTGYNNNWWKMGATHVKYDKSTRKIGLENMNNGMMNESNTAVIPLADENTPGLISVNNIKTINNQSILGQGNIEINLNNPASKDVINISTQPTLLPYKYLGMAVYEHLILYNPNNKEDFVADTLLSKLGITINEPIIISANFISFSKKEDNFIAVHYDVPIRIVVNSSSKCLVIFDWDKLMKYYGSAMGYSDNQTMYIRLIYADGSQR